MFISSIYPAIHYSYKKHSKVCAANSSAKLYDPRYRTMISFHILFFSSLFLCFSPFVVLRESSGMSFPAVADKVSYDVHSSHVRCR